MNLAGILRAAAGLGLDALNIWSFGAEWQANVKLKGSNGWNIRFDEDIAVAVEKAMEPVVGAAESALIEHQPDPIGRLKDALDELREAIRELV